MRLVPNSKIQLSFRGTKRKAQSSFKISNSGASLVVQWLRIHLPMQGTWIPYGATKPECHNYCHELQGPQATTAETVRPRAWGLQRLSPRAPAAEAGA